MENKEIKNKLSIKKKLLLLFFILMILAGLFGTLCGGAFILFDDYFGGAFIISIPSVLVGTFFIVTGILLLKDRVFSIKKILKYFSVILCIYILIGILIYFYDYFRLSYIKKK